MAVVAHVHHKLGSPFRPFVRYREIGLKRAIYRIPTHRSTADNWQRRVAMEFQIMLNWNGFKLHIKCVVDSEKMNTHVREMRTHEFSSRKMFSFACVSVSERTDEWSKANEIKIQAPTTKPRQYRWRHSAAASLLRRRRLGRSQHTILTTLDEGAHDVLKNLAVVCACCVFQSIAFEMCAPYVTHKPIQTHTRARPFSFSLTRSFACCMCAWMCVCSVYAHFCFHSRLRVIVVGYPILHAVSRYER